jgi:uncharacterized protein (TIGR02271 family)
LDTLVAKENIMTTRRTTVVGVFNDKTLAERAIDALKDAGFSNDEIRYSGASGGGFFDNLKSWLSGEDTGTTGNVESDLKNMGVPEGEANYYAREYSAGHPIVAVRSPGHENDALSIMRSNGSSHYDMASDATGTAAPYASRDKDYTDTTDTGMRTGYTQQQPGRTTDEMAGINRDKDYTDTTDTGMRTGYTQPSGMTSDEMARNAQPGMINETAVPDQTANTGTTNRDINMTGENAQSVRVREEQLRAEKQRVQAGEVRVHKEVVEEQKSFEVPVKHEEVVVERKPIVEPRPTDVPLGQNETIRIPVSEEQVNVTKTPVESEEIALRKRQVEEQKRVSDTVRREEAHIEPSGDIPIVDESDEEKRP